MSIMKKYVFIVPSLASGGAERAVVNFASGLVNQGEQATIVIYFRMKDEYAVDQKVRIVNLSGGDMHTYEKLSYLKKVRMLRKIVKEEQPDYILPFLGQVCFHTALACFDMHGKVINTIRINPAMGPSNKWVRKLRDFIVIHSWKTIVQNEEQKHYFPKSSQKHIYVLRNAVNSSLFDIERNAENQLYRIVALGRLEDQKNYPVLIDAIQEVVKSHQNIALEIYGEGSKREAISKQISCRGLEAYVHLIGRTNNVNSVYEKANLYVLSSDFEGMPNTLIEAMAAGVPAISTNCPTGPADIIQDSQNGLLVPMNDAQSLANAIVYMMEHKEQSEAMGRAGREAIREKCGIERIVKELRSICEA